MYDFREAKAGENWSCREGEINVLILPFRTVLIANYIKTLSKEISPTFSSSDLAKIKKFSRSKSIVSELLFDFQMYFQIFSIHVFLIKNAVILPQFSRTFSRN